MSLKDVVAIIGRPNIGKSTLFNRLTRTRKSIVADESGVTRDRIYQPVEWAGKSFMLIDTGGLVPDTKEFFESKIKAQVEIAMDEADSIVFLLDVETGITQIDSEIAAILKKYPRRVTVVVNKVDHEMREMDISEFYNLGLGEPIGISAMSGRNIGNMLTVISEDIIEDAEYEEFIDPRLKIAVIGKPNVGKSSLVNAFLNQQKMIVSNIPGTTRDSVDSVLKYQGEEIVLIDTAGLRKKRKVKESIEYYSLLRTLRAIEKCDVAILMIDAKEGLTKQDIDILMEAEKLQRGIIIAINKWDLIENKNTHSAKKYEQLMRTSIEWMSYVPVKFVSVKEKQRLLKLVDLSKTIREEMKKRVTTSSLNDYILPIIKKTTPPSAGNKFIKIKFASQVKSDPPIFAFFLNEPLLLKDNYKRFLERKIREKYGFRGVPLGFRYIKKSEDRRES